MKYQEYKPSKILAPYVKCYYVLAYEDGSSVEDQAFATGCVEVMFMLQGNPWQIKNGNTFVGASHIDLWGQVVKPLTFRVPGRSVVFGIRFYPATAALMIRDDVNLFNERVFNLTSVTGNTINTLYEKLQEAKSADEQIELAEAYLQKKIAEQHKAIQKIDIVRHVMGTLTHESLPDNISTIASRYGITSRYLQKIFLQYTGLTPKMHVKISRFQHSLLLMSEAKHTLTAIAHASGYFDQSHFIREFKSFTGNPPSRFDGSTNPAASAIK